MNPVYLDTARLLARVAPVVMSGGTFALKGGTAINLFVRNMPRLSVDIDRVFVDRTPGYVDAVARITASLRDAATRLLRLGIASVLHHDGAFRLFARVGRTEVKMEVTPVMRGVLYPVHQRSWCRWRRTCFWRRSELPSSHSRIFTAASLPPRWISPTSARLVRRDAVA